MNEQLPLWDLEEGRALRDEGVDLVASHNPDFVRIIRRALADYSMAMDCAVTADNARNIARALRILPHHPNAWGAIFRHKGWILLGHAQSEVPSNHAREVRRWKWSSRVDPG